MSTLPIEQAVMRLTQNEERFDKFINEATGYTTSGAVAVPSIREVIGALQEGANTFVSTSDGLAGTSNGEFFFVPDVGDTFTRLYKNNSGVADLINSYASATGLTKVLSPALDATARTSPFVLDTFDSQRQQKVRTAFLDTLTKTYDVVSPDGYTANSVLNDYAWLSYKIGSYEGMPSDGILTKVRMRAGILVNSGAIYQMWLMRPSSLPTSGNITLTLVAPIGSVSLTPTTAASDYELELSGLNIPCKQGDLIAVRGINCGIGFGSGSVTYTSDYGALFSIGSDTSLSAMPSSITTAVQVGRRIDMHVEVSPGNFIGAPGTPGGSLQLDNNRAIPPGVVRSYDAPWSGKRIGVVGTSITAGAAASSPLGFNGHIGQLGRMLNCQMFNRGIGNSLITKNGNILSMSQTNAEAIANAGGNPAAAAYSYETTIIGQDYDCLIMEHGFNDAASAVSLGTIDSLDRTTFYGAYNYVIQKALDDKPTLRIVLFNLPHVYGAPVNLSAATEQAGYLAVRAAIQALAAKWNFPVLDMCRLNGINAYSIAAGTAINPDQVHPTQWAHDNMARLAYKFMVGL